MLWKVVKFNLVRVNGTLMGTDEFGNEYYEDVDAQHSGRKRWVEYASSTMDPSEVAPYWHGWLHYMSDQVPTAEMIRGPKYKKFHHENKTGTIEAYHPSSYYFHEKHISASSKYNAAEGMKMIIIFSSQQLLYCSLLKYFHQIFLSDEFCSSQQQRHCFIVHY